MKTNFNLSNICESCDYSPSFCDGDVNSCVNAALYGSNSEIGRESGAFDKKNFSKECEIKICK